MKKWKKKGSKHYKRNVEVLDLLIAHKNNLALSSFCLGNIVKYADRNYGKFYVNSEDLDKIIHYAEILKEELCQNPKSPNCIELHPKVKSTLGEEKP